MHWYDIPILLLLLVSVVGLPLGLLFLFFKRKRPLGKQISIASGIGLICSVVLIAVLADRSARDEGFKDAADKRAAREQGFNDPKQWAVFRDKAEGTTRLAAQQSAVQDSRVETGKREVQSRREDATTTVAGAGSKQKQSTGTAEPIALPQSQTRFLLAVEAGRAAYTAGSNDLAKGAARPAGADAICAALGGPQIVGGSRDLQYSINLNATD